MTDKQRSADDFAVIRSRMGELKDEARQAVSFARTVQRPSYMTRYLRQDGNIFCETDLSGIALSPGDSLKFTVIIDRDSGEIYGVAPITIEKVPLPAQP